MRMAETPPLRILIGSAGRRVYLIEWFERAFREQGIRGEVHVTDADDASAAYSAADHRHLVPRYTDAAYPSAMRTLIDELEPALFFSVNDHELALLARTGLADEFAAAGTTTLSLRPEIHAAVHDKLSMFRALTERGIPTVETALLSDTESVASIAQRSAQLIIKDRHGSGSSGLQRVAAADLDLAVRWFERQGLAPDSLVVQPALPGAEYGIDVVAPLTDGAHRVAVLARRKVRMRSGETDQAVSVLPSPFEATAAAVAAWTGHRGSIDIDLMEDADGVLRVIDINPRFGGGYPFSHLAGADLPGSFVAQLCGIRGERIDAFHAYSVGRRSSKHEGIVAARTAASDA